MGMVTYSAHHKTRRGAWVSQGFASLYPAAAEQMLRGWHKRGYEAVIYAETTFGREIIGEVSRHNDGWRWWLDPEQCSQMESDAAPISSNSVVAP